MESPNSLPEDLDDTINLESKVLLALTRLQNNKKFKGDDGISCCKVVHFLKTHYAWLDGDILSQVKTVLLTCVKNGVVCVLDNSKYRLLVPFSKDMTSSCATRILHGPNCSCLFTLKYINSPNICCLYKKKGGVKKKINILTKKPTRKTHTRQCVKFRRKKKPNGCVLKEKNTQLLTKKGFKNLISDCIDSQNLIPKKKCKTCNSGGVTGIPSNIFSPRDERNEIKK